MQTTKILSLNPCCNGIYLIIDILSNLQKETQSLNPCCNGIYLIIDTHDYF